MEILTSNNPGKGDIWLSKIHKFFHLDLKIRLLLNSLLDSYITIVQHEQRTKFCSHRGRFSTQECLALCSRVAHSCSSPSDYVPVLQESHLVSSVCQRSHHVHAHTDRDYSKKLVTSSGYFHSPSACEFLLVKILVKMYE